MDVNQEIDRINGAKSWIDGSVLNGANATLDRSRRFPYNVFMSSLLNRVDSSWKKQELTEETERGKAV